MSCKSRSGLDIVAEMKRRLFKRPDCNDWLHEFSKDCSQFAIKLTTHLLRMPDTGKLTPRRFTQGRSHPNLLAPSQGNRNNRPLMLSINMFASPFSALSVKANLLPKSTVTE